MGDISLFPGLGSILCHVAVMRETIHLSPRERKSITRSICLSPGSRLVTTTLIVTQPFSISEWGEKKNQSSPTSTRRVDTGAAVSPPVGRVLFCSSGCEETLTESPRGRHYILLHLSFSTLSFLKAQTPKDQPHRAAGSQSFEV